jgi:2-phospho-L-lactate guanylyltransferase
MARFGYRAPPDGYHAAMEQRKAADERRSGLDALHAIVPLRSLAGGKARLGEAIDAEEREELLVGMLRQTIGLLLDLQACRAVHVVSTDPRVLPVAADCGARPLRQLDGDLNAGLLVARDVAIADGASAVLIVPADLPLLSVEALDRLIEAADAALAAGSGRAMVVIAPSDARAGTNALLLSPPDVIAPQFGVTSFEAHVRAAASVEASLQVVTDPALGFDLDTPEDLEMLPAELLTHLLALAGDPVGAGRE